MGLGTVASNYAEEARKASITLMTIYAWLRRLLKDDDTATDIDTACLNEVEKGPYQNLRTKTTYSKRAPPPTPLLPSSLAGLAPLLPLFLAALE